MTFVYPALRGPIAASEGKCLLAGAPIQDVRQATAERAALRPPGPHVDRVFDAMIPAGDRSVPVRVYHPDGAKAVVVAFHGGSWAVGNLDTFDATARYLAVESRQAVVSVDYRLAPENLFPAAFDDAWVATSWVATNASVWGLPAGKIMLLGESAGGTLAAAVALKARDAGGPAIGFQVLIYPPLDATAEGGSLDQYSKGFLLTKQDILFGYENYGIHGAAAARDWRVSPLLASNFSGLPPVLLISAELDPLADQPRAFAQLLTAAGVEATHVVYTGVTHLFFSMRGALAAAEQAQRQAAFALRSAAGE